MEEETGKMFKRKIEVTDQEERLSQLLKNIETQMVTSNENMDVFHSLQAVVKEIDFSILDSEALSNKVSKRSRSNNKKDAATTGFERNDELMEKIKKQIDNVRNALNVIYEIENASFKKFISKTSEVQELQERDESSETYFDRLKKFAQALPLWVDLDGEHPPPLCGCLKAEKDHIAKDGDLVAAFVLNYSDDTDCWILAEVVSYDPIQKKYTIYDIYDDGTNLENVLTCESIIPLPKYRVDPKYNPNALFQMHQNVLALYPGTTCFYHAIVCKLPVNAEGCYSLLFTDDKKELEIHPRFVINDMCHEKQEE